MNLFDLFAKITLDTSEYDKGLDGASSKTSAFGEKLKSGLSTAAKAGAAAIGAASTAIGVLSKKSVEGYADYEQLAGGVETLFKSSSKAVLEYADNAYKTAGMSANEYMETVTSFSASLLQSLGGDTEKAANKADQAIIDMSDNANKMGTSMEMIQNAYQGFAKQNYTMLDNLKLGYGGTKEEMARLLEDAEKLSGIEYDISSYADVVDAIHVIQKEMGIAGTTAKESGETISGSISSMKSAWENLVVGFTGGNAQLDVLISNFVESVKTAAGNLIPTVTQALEGIGSMVQQLAPTLSDQLPVLIESTVPALLDAGTTLLSALLDGILASIPALAEAALNIINKLVEFLVSNLPTVVEGALQIIVALANGISENLPALIPTIVDVILNITEALIQNAPLLIDAAIQIIKGFKLGLIKAFPEIIKHVPKLIVQLVKAFGKAGLSIIEGIVDGFFEAIPELIKSIKNAVDILIDEFCNLLGIHSPSTVFSEIGGNIIAGLLNGIVSAWNAIIGFFQSAISNVINFFKSAWGTIQSVWNVAVGFFSGIWEGIKGVFSTVVDTFVSIFSAAWNGIVSVWSAVVGFFSGIWEGIKAVFSTVSSVLIGFFSTAWNGIVSVWNAVVGFFSGIWNGIRSVFSVVSSTLTGFFTDAWNGIKNAWSSVKSFFSDVWNNIVNSFDVSAALEWGRDLIDNFINGIKEKWSDLKDTVANVAGSVKDFLGFSEPKKGPLSNFHTYAPDMMKLFAQGIKENAHIVQNQLDKSIDYDMGALSLDFDKFNLQPEPYNNTGNNPLGVTPHNYGSTTKPTDSTTEKQPAVIIVQLESGLEIARQMVADINQLRRIEGI